MEKISVSIDNYSAGKVYPCALFIYGTYREDKTPNFGLFCWFSYCWDSELAVMACIGGSKLTKDRIHSQRMFSANLVTEPLIPLADYFGSTQGYTHGKMDIPVEAESGKVLPVPVLKNSPWIYELEVSRTVQLEGSDLFICKIRNILADKELADKSKNDDDLINKSAPALWFGSGKYYAANTVMLGKTGDWKDLFKK